MRLVLVLGIVGRILRLFSIAFTVPFLLALWDKQTGQAVHFASVTELKDSKPVEMTT